MTKNECIVRISKVKIIEGHDLKVASFDYILKMGDFEQTVKGTTLTKRTTMFNQSYGLMPYASKFTGSDGQDRWHAKSGVNPILQEKLIAEVLKAIEFAKNNCLDSLGFKELLAFYN